MPHAATLLLGVALLVLALPTAGIALGRWRFVPIRSGSMAPLYPTGSPAWVVRARVPLLGYASIFARSLGPLLAALVLVAVGLPWVLRLIWRSTHGPITLRGDRHADGHV